MPVNIQVLTEMLFSIGATVHLRRIRIHTDEVLGLVRWSGMLEEGRNLRAHCLPRIRVADRGNFAAAQVVDFFCEVPNFRQMFSSTLPPHPVSPLIGSKL